jgi:pimeloyl-ACP methyl ester carboxylesterase
MRLSNMGYFWVGPEVTKKDYGTVVVGQMYVQYLIPEQIRQPIPIVLVHGGVGQSLHYMGVDGNASWAHYYVQNGYQVYLVDRQGHGRSPVHLDGIGPIGNAPGYGIAADFQKAANGTPRRWMGTGQVGDPALDQIVAGQNAAPLNTELIERLWRTTGAALLEKIGPAIIQTHSAGGPWGFIVANERPALTKAVVSFEGAAGPVLDQKNQPNPLPNLKGMPIMYLTSELAGRIPLGQAIADSLVKSGALAEHINLAKDRGITGNAHFAMFETDRKEVFEVIRGWIESKFPPNPAARQTARG